MATKPTRFAQMGNTTEKVKVYTGIPKQLVVDTSKWRMRLLDGATPGGFEFAMVSDLQDYATHEVCTQLIYEINEFRRKSTAYQVGDKVGCAFQYERFLECTKAGTTSADLLDTRSVTHGQVITDGTVEWTVRTHVRSINGSVAGADGNVLVDVGAKTVEGKAPDGQGNIALGLHAVATSGSYNDLANKPSIPATPNAYVTKTWRSGAQWYRRWSDGRLEQGGRIKLQVWTGCSSANRTFSLPTSFSNTTYTTVVTGEEGYGWGGLKIVSQTTNSVAVTSTGASTNDYVDYVHFYCSGY